MRLPRAPGCLTLLLAVHLAEALRSQSGRAGPDAPSRTIKIIGAGHPRTGTQSLAMALLKLGYNPTHGERLFAKRPTKDFYTGRLDLPGRVPPLLDNAGRAGINLLQRSLDDAEYPVASLSNTNLTALGLWSDWLYANASLEPLLDEIVQSGFDSTTPDIPMGLVAKELIRRYPDAKVILSVHPHGPKAWVDSMLKQCWTCPLGIFTWQASFHSKFSRCAQEMFKFGTDLNYTMRYACMKEYEAHNDEIKRLVPPEQLLEFAPTHGWGPLCRFLKVPEPNDPFPSRDLWSRQ